MSPAGWALLVSALLHLGLLWFLWGRPPPSHLPPASKPVVLDWVFVQPPPSAPQAKLDPGPVFPHSKRPPQPRPPPAPGLEAEAPVGLKAPPSDSPRAMPSLLPEAGIALAPELPIPEKGRTLRNQGPVDPTARLEQERAVVAGRVTEWAQDALSVHRVHSGVVDTHIQEVGKQLASEMTLQPKFELQLGASAQKLLAEYKQSLARYGATGNPGEVVEGRTFSGNVEALRDQSERLRRYAEASLVKEFVVVLELRQDAAGKVTAVRMLRSSRNQAFDEHVVSVVQTSTRLAALPDYLAARHPAGLRTVWEFRGRHRVLKKVRQFDVQNPGDAAYLAGMGLASLLMGAPFDETTGDLWILDLRNPGFDVHSRLLQYY